MNYNSLKLSLEGYGFKLIRLDDTLPVDVSGFNDDIYRNYLILDKDKLSQLSNPMNKTELINYYKTMCFDITLIKKPS